MNIERKLYENVCDCGAKYYTEDPDFYFICKKCFDEYKTNQKEQRRMRCPRCTSDGVVPLSDLGRVSFKCKHCEYEWR